MLNAQARALAESQQAGVHFTRGYNVTIGMAGKHSWNDCPPLRLLHRSLWATTQVQLCLLHAARLEHSRAAGRASCEQNMRVANVLLLLR